MKNARAPLAVALLALCAPLVARSDVVINEVHYAPRDNTVHEEFVELYNRGVTPVDVSGWFLDGAVEYILPDGTGIGPDAYLVVAQDPDVVQGIYGPGLAVFGPFDGRLANEGETVELRNQYGELVDRVDYQRGFPWPTLGGDTGFSMELVHPQLDNDLGGSWRASNPGLDSSNTLVAAGAVFRYFKGTQEPPASWRTDGFDASGWPSGPAPIGYGDNHVRTNLDDMRNGYSTVYLRREFEVDSAAAIRALSLAVQYDDGFVVWINGTHVADANVPSPNLSSSATADSALENMDFVSFDLPAPSAYLVDGTNVLTLQLVNASIGGSSDAWIDVSLSTAVGAGTGPSPGARNNTFAENIAPHMRQVDHSPDQPRSDEPVRITVKVTDADGVAGVTLDYQVVDPGAYIELTDPAYETNWTTVGMNDQGQGGDEEAGDSIYTVTLPASLQEHRRLIRYRITAEDLTGRALRAPYNDDPVPNFAYFVYDGVPGWSGAVQPGSSSATRREVVDYSPGTMASIPVYHLISKRSSVEDATWFRKYSGSEYLWMGTLVYDGDVYDHVRYRARGGVWRYAMGKNMWKFNFWRGHRFEARDDWGRPYDTEWDKLNFSAIIQQGNFRHRGEQGLFESTGFRLFNLTGVEAPKTHYVLFRIIDEAEEFGASQYDGDFWGLYLVVEQMDGRFLEEHDLPDGNLYKMEGGTGELNNLGYLGPKDRSDLDSYMDTYEGTSPSDSWWRQNMDLPRYYSYRSIVEGIHHYDIANGKNYFYFKNPETGLWSTLPWDLDLTWADNMYGSGNEPFKSRVLGRATFSKEYKNRLREIRDLLYNSDQMSQMIDEYAAIVDPPGESATLVDADRSMWDYNPVMVDDSLVNLSKAGHGRFYQESSSKTFRGMAQLMMNYVLTRGSWIDSQVASDSAIPARPGISYEGPPGHPVDALLFQTSTFRDPQGTSTFGALKWRIAEVTPPGAPDFDPSRPRLYEIDAAWESDALTSFQSDFEFPDWVARPGARYRVRARMKDDTDRWSHWSSPIEFTAGEPTSPFPVQESLRITEILYNPEGTTEDREFVELRNIGDSTLQLDHVAFVDGIEFDFSDSAYPTLPPGEFILVVQNRLAFLRAYDLTDADVRIAGEYSGRFDNAGERVSLRYGAGGDVQTFTYSDLWYPSTDGLGFSLTAVEPEASGVDWNDPISWAPSSVEGGTPGWDDSGSVPGGRQLPGDLNQDAFLDVGDAVALLLHLFRGNLVSLPCEGASIGEAGNLAIADFAGDGLVDATDAVQILAYLFLDGPPHTRGTRCERLDGCPNVCGF